MVFTLILSIIALAALYQLAKVIFFAICWLGCELLWLALYLLGAVFAPPVAPVPVEHGGTNVIPFPFPAKHHKVKL